MSLPPEIRAVADALVREVPPKEIHEIIAEVVENLAGKNPDVLVSAIREEGGTAEFVRTLMDYVKSVYDPRSRSATKK